MKKLQLTLGLIIMFFLFNITGYSQAKSNYKCMYSFNIVRDTTKNTLFKKETYVVQIGERYTKGYTYSNYYVDSLRTYDPKKLRKMRGELINATFKDMKTTNDRSRIGNSIHGKGAFESYTYKDYKKGKITVVEEVSGEHIVYDDELKAQEWNILSDTMSVLGYRSQKAICTFRGRDFIAWFTTEIPMSEGPWKFYGLPGLITKLHDTKNHYSFELISFQKLEEDVDIKISKSALKMKRIEYLRENANGELENKILSSKAMSMGFGSTSNNKIKLYDNIELDYK